MSRWAAYWYKLGKAQLDNGSIPEAIESYLKAEDPQDYVELIQKAEREENYTELTRYLLMARNKIKDCLHGMGLMMQLQLLICHLCLCARQSLDPALLSQHCVVFFNIFLDPHGVSRNIYWEYDFRLAFDTSPGFWR